MVQSSAAVDVVIPVRNGERFIEACLDSIRSQVLQPDAVIVVDDGSTDRTLSILSTYQQRWEKLQVIRSDPRGVSHARNLGLAACTAPYVAFMDSDDVWLPEKLKRQISLFQESSSKVGLVHCAFVQIDESGNALPNGRVYSPTKRGNVLQAMLSEFYHILGPSTVVARRELVLRLGAFDETLTIGEDLDLWLRLAHASDVDYVPEVLASLRSYPESSFSRAVADNPELVFFQRLKIWSRWLHLVPDKKPVIEAFRKEALAVSAANVVRRRPSFGFYGRLRRSGLPLSNCLFKTRWDYYGTLSRVAAIDVRIKTLIAKHVIFKSPVLLRLCKKFGKCQTLP